ncbi:MAG: hypothetical protein AB8G99_22555 [Planctomycetaceae bacterium]
MSHPKLAECASGTSASVEIYCAVFAWLVYGSTHLVVKVRACDW